MTNGSIQQSLVPHDIRHNKNDCYEHILDDIELCAGLMLRPRSLGESLNERRNT
jgi:hypothetical protein